MLYREGKGILILTPKGNGVDVPIEALGRSFYNHAIMVGESHST